MIFNFLNIVLNLISLLILIFFFLKKELSFVKFDLNEVSNKTEIQQLAI